MPTSVASTAAAGIPTASPGRTGGLPAGPPSECARLVTAHGSSRPQGVRCWASALAGEVPAVTGSMYQAGRVPVRRTLRLGHVREHWALSPVSSAKVTVSRRELKGRLLLGTGFDPWVRLIWSVAFERGLQGAYSAARWTCGISLTPALASTHLSVYHRRWPRNMVFPCYIRFSDLIACPK
jgi:hypothetical protein